MVLSHQRPRQLPHASFAWLVRGGLCLALCWRDRWQSGFTGLPQIMSRLHLQPHVGGGAFDPLLKPQGQTGRYWRMAVDDAG